MLTLSKTSPFPTSRGTREDLLLVTAVVAVPAIIETAPGKPPLGRATIPKSEPPGAAAAFPTIQLRTWMSREA